MKLKILLMATCLLLPMSSAFAETVDEYVAGLKKEASIGNTEAQKELDQFQSLGKSANAGDAQAQYELGMFYVNHSSLDTNKNKQEAWFVKSANQGNSDAQEALIKLYIAQSENMNSISDVNKKKAAVESWQKLGKLLQTKAEKGDAKDQYRLALYYLSSDDQVTKRKANVWIEKAADQGLVKARVKLGEAYLYGKNGIDKNYNKAKDIFQKLADERYVIGAYYLAVCYHLGYGVPKDEKKAVELFTEAADNGDIDAANYLAKAYFTGIENVIPKDANKFMTYYNQVCANKRSMICIKLMSNIAGDCVEKYRNNTEFLDPNSNTDPVCKEIVTQSLR